jgi:hypothetical protein
MTRLSTNRRSPLNRPWVVWLAVWLALFAALAPTVSYAFHAAANRDAADLHAVCSSAFKAETSSAAPSAPVWLQVVEAAPTDDSTPQEPAGMGGHCAQCLLRVDLLASPPTPMVGFAIQLQAYAVPVAPPPQFVKSFLELNPPPRGPPAIS